MVLNKKIIGSALLVSTLVFAGCGSAGNDQGISFTLLGFTPITGDSATGGTGCDLNGFDNTISIPIGESGESSTAAVETKRCILVQNNMTAVAVRTERANIEYFIPGADRQPPSTSIPVTVTVGTAPGTDAPEQGSGAEGDDEATDGENNGVTIIGNRGGTQINMIPPEIRSWISLNRGSLPEAPFSLEIIVNVIGVTTAGDRLETNKAYYQAQVVNDFLINPGTGIDEGEDEDTSALLDEAFE